MRFLSLFAGIGGMDLGLEWAGWQCVGQCEIDPFCQKVLAKHWPNVPRWDDVRTLTKEWIHGQCGDIDAIVGGFPCQDISNAGKREGITGKRSGLWTYYARLIRDLRPRFVIVENVAALLIRGMDTVLGDLSKARYDAEWTMLPLCSLGASHPRERMFIVAYPANHKRIHKPNLRQATKRLLDDANTWSTRPWNEANAKLCRMDDGPADRVDRTSALGNAVGPPAAYVLGKAINESLTV